MHHLCSRSRRHSSLSRGFMACQVLVRFFILHRIKPHVPPLVWTLSILLSFILANTMGISNLIRSLNFRLLVSVSVQQSAFAIGVLSNLYVFHHFAGNSLYPYQLSNFHCLSRV
ncbi:hypothetical protein CR513_39704, partial [Mucuna pruriens]